MKIINLGAKNCPVERNGFRKEMSIRCELGRPKNQLIRVLRIIHVKCQVFQELS